MAGWAVAGRLVRLVTPLPHRISTGTGTGTGIGTGIGRWSWFVALARQSRSTPELLGSVLGRRIIVHPLRRHQVTPQAPLATLRLSGGDPVALDEHLLVDTDPPHLALGLSSAVIVLGRLPAEVRSALHEDRVLAQLLDATAAFWTSETLDVEELTAAAASFPTDRAPDTPMLRLTRRLSLIGSPIAVVIDEIPQPPLPRSADARTPLAHP